MANLNIGELFNNYRILSSKSFRKLPPGEKSIFLKQLYSSLKTETAHVLDHIDSYAGVKLHFKVNHSASGEYVNLPTDLFLRKTSFYANKTIVTFPFRPVVYDKKKNRIKSSDLPKDSLLLGKYETVRKGADSEIIPHSKLYCVHGKEIDIFIDLVSSCKDLISYGSVNILPSFNVTGTENWRVLRDKYRLINANFNYEELSKQFFEHDLDLKITHDLVSPTIYLPHFKHIPNKNIIEVRNTERKLYQNFQYELSASIDDLSEPQTEKELLKTLIRIHTGVEKLNRKYEEMLINYNQDNKYALIGFSIIGLTMLLPREIRSEIKEVLGKMDGFKWFVNKKDYRQKMENLKNEDYYLMWKVANIKDTKKRINK